MTDEETDELAGRVREFLAGHDPAAMDRSAFLRARFDAGLAWVSFPVGLGGLGLSRSRCNPRSTRRSRRPARRTTTRCVSASGWAWRRRRSSGTVPTTSAERWLRPLWTGEEVWCQLFSEPGAGSDLAALGTRAVPEPGPDGQPGWRVNGQKVWTSMAHEAQWAILVTRTDPDVPKHAGHDLLRV